MYFLNYLVDAGGFDKSYCVFYTFAGPLSWRSSAGSIDTSNFFISSRNFRHSRACDVRLFCVPHIVSGAAVSVEFATKSVT